MLRRLTVSLPEAGILLVTIKTICLFFKATNHPKARRKTGETFYVIPGYPFVFQQLARLFSFVCDFYGVTVQHNSVVAVLHNNKTD